MTVNWMSTAEVFRAAAMLAICCGQLLAQSDSETVLYSFTGEADGGFLQAGVIRDAAGNLFGTTVYGGAHGQGTVFKLSPGGAETVLYSFTGGADGAQPVAAVSLDGAGNLYGTTVLGGAYGQGTVFELSPGGGETVLHSFQGGTDGAGPLAAVILDAAGNLYGTTENGGEYGQGTVFRLSPSGVETVLHSFIGGADGAEPQAGVILDSAGNLYGTTYLGGAYDSGIVFRLSPGGLETALYTFEGGLDGGNSFATLILDAAGNLYGTTLAGGAYGQGAVFQLSPGGVETVLHSFTGGADGAQPQAGVIRDAAGNLYGTALLGGDEPAPNGGGTVFRLSPSGVLTVLHSFSGTDGSEPFASLILDAVGNLYGTTIQGGADNEGTVFQLTPQSVPIPDGAYPQVSVMLDAAGNLYGTTLHGGEQGYGTVFQALPGGMETVLYSFQGGADGAYSFAPVIRDAAGNLYGTTIKGGDYSYGTVFKLSPGGVETVLHSFQGGTDGTYPLAAVTLDAAGNLYGTTSGGGKYGDGIVFRVSPGGVETVLYSFQGGTDGAYPQSPVILDPAGNLYGTTQQGGGVFRYGTIFRLSPSGAETVLYSFRGGAEDGAHPYSAGVIRDAAGNLYGTTEAGGPKNYGTVFRLSPSGEETVLYWFQGGTDGITPEGGVIRDPAGNLYGTTEAGGGAHNWGTVFQLSPEGVETVLHSFEGGADDGAQPHFAGVVLDASGNLYGTTPYGGTKDQGTVFQISPGGVETVLHSF